MSSVMTKRSVRTWGQSVDHYARTAARFRLSAIMEIAPNDSAMDDLVQEAICIAWSKYLSRKLKRDIEPRLAVLYSVRDACRDLLEGKRFVADYELQTDDYSDVSSKRDRAIMLLHGNHGLSKVEIAKRIGCSTRTVFLAIRRVRQMREFA